MASEDYDRGKIDEKEEPHRSQESAPQGSSEALSEGRERGSLTAKNGRSSTRLSVSGVQNLQNVTITGGYGQSGGATGAAAAPANMFADADAMRAQLHENIAKKDYDVTDYYYETGVFQAIATNARFGATTLFVISLNALWIGIDVECNDPNAEGDIPGCPVQPSDTSFWLAGEQAFCAFFSFELLVRWLAFKSKRFAIRDKWFVFDSVLVFFMVIETWLLPIATGGNSDALSDFALLRMLRLMRLTRMVRLMRSVPELMTLLKGMVIACKSVSYTLLLLIIFMYIFAIIFKSQLVETEIERLKFHFSGIPRSMWTLLIAGCFLDDISIVANLLVKEGVVITFFFIFFVLLSALMVLNMLIGVLCAVVSAVAAAEKEKALVTYVKTKLISVLETLDEDGNGTISKKEFDQLVNIPEAIAALDELGVDVPNLVSLADHLFDEDDLGDPDERRIPSKDDSNALAPADSHTSRRTVKVARVPTDDSRQRQVTQDTQDDSMQDDDDDELQTIELNVMTFAEFLEMVLRLRSDNMPSVADIVELRKLIFRGQKSLGKRLNQVEKGQLELQRGIRMMCEQLDSALTLSLSLSQRDKRDNVSAGNGKQIQASGQTDRAELRQDQRLQAL